MNLMYERYPVEMWTTDGIIWAIGIFFWFVTYVGAPMASKRSGHYVSGVPGAAFITFLIAGLLSPIKWLALLCFLDFSIVQFVFSSIINSIKKQ